MLDWCVTNYTGLYLLWWGSRRRSWPSHWDCSPCCPPWPHGGGRRAEPLCCRWPGSRSMTSGPCTTTGRDTGTTEDRPTEGRLFSFIVLQHPGQNKHLNKIEVRISMLWGCDTCSVFSHLKSVVKWKPVEENIGEELAQAEDAIHHPVRQPFCVVFFAWTFDGFDSADTSGNDQRPCLHLDLTRDLHNNIWTPSVCSLCF